MAAEAFLSSGMIGRIGEIVMEHTPAITQLRDMMNDEARDANESERVVDAGVAFLANISRTEAGSSAFLDKESLMTKLITEFVATPPKGFDCFQHVASILMNISQMERGRKIILNKTDAYLAKISPFLLSGTTTRRYGVAGAIRNVCFEKVRLFVHASNEPFLHFVLTPIVNAVVLSALVAGLFLVASQRG